MRLGAWLLMLGRKLEAGGNLMLKDTGITVVQLLMLRYIRLNPEQAQIADIARFFGVKHTSTIHVVQSMEKKGYVYREQIPHSCGKNIKLTELGEKVAAHNEDVTDQTEEIMLKGFSEEEKTLLFQFLSRINDNMDEGFQ